MSPNFQPADLARASAFYATLFIGRGKYEKRETETLEAARAARDELNANFAKNGHRAMVYMVVDGRNELVPEAFDPANPDAFVPSPAAVKAARKAKLKAMAAAKKPAAKPAKAAKKAPAKAKPAKEPKAPKAAKPANGQRAAILADAEAGILPKAPDFSAATHTRFRPKLAALVALVEARDIAGLKAFAINPISTSPKAMDKYRNLAVIALTAQAAKEKA